MIFHLSVKMFENAPGFLGATRGRACQPGKADVLGVDQLMIIQICDQILHGPID